MKLRTIFVLFALVAVIGSSVLGQSTDRLRTFTGTYTCIDCNLTKTIGAHSQCDIYGHNYGIKLSDGTFLHLLRNDHSAELVKGGGRSNFTISITGIYDRKARTIDVQKYSIDGVETAWSQETHRMESPLTHKQLLSRQTPSASPTDTLLTTK
jgi:hypothetical protein